MSGLLLSLILLFPQISSAADSFCNDPHAAICSQSKIADDLGVTMTGPNNIGIMQKNRAILANEARAKFKAVFAYDADGKKLRHFAKLTGYDGYLQTSCWSFSWTSENCRSAVTEALVKKTLATTANTAEDNSEIEKGYFTFQKAKSLRLWNDLLSDPTFVKVAREIQAKELTLVSRPKSVAATRQAFEDIKKIYLRKLNEWPVDEPFRALMKERVAALKFKDRDPEFCGKYLGSLYLVNARYSPNASTVTVCNGYYLRTNSPAVLAATVGHEIAHSFDPCNLFMDAVESVPGFEYDLGNIAKPMGSLSACLESKSTKGLSSPQCNVRDPLPELFADWASAEVLSEYLETAFPSKSSADSRRRYQAAFADLCGSQDSPDDPHPSAKERINNIFFQNAKIRAAANCGPSKPSCVVGKTISATSTPINRKTSPAKASK